MFSKRFPYRYGFTHASPERHFRLMEHVLHLQDLPFKGAVLVPLRLRPVWLQNGRFNR